MRYNHKYINISIEFKLKKRKIGWNATKHEILSLNREKRSTYNAKSSLGMTNKETSNDRSYDNLTIDMVIAQQ